jgi:hypothetical protein
MHVRLVYGGTHSVLGDSISVSLEVRGVERGVEKRCEVVYDFPQIFKGQRTQFRTKAHGRC